MNFQCWHFIFPLFVFKLIALAENDFNHSKDQEPKICPIGTLDKPHFNEEPKSFQTVTKRKMYVFSAFYEERPDASGPSIRIIAVGLQERFHEIGDLYCNLWYKNESEAISTKADYKVIYQSTLHADEWTSHFIICKLPPRQTIPYVVSVTHLQCAKPENELLVLNRKPIPPEQKKGHALCIQPLYNQFRNWSIIAETFEIHRLLGASEIIIYTYSIAKETQRLLDLYTIGNSAEFQVTVIPWPLPVQLRSNTNVFCQRCTINDCYYRMRNKYKYITISDLDEVLVPRMVQTWPELMSQIENSQYGAYLFQHAYFRRNYTLQEKEQEVLISQSSFWRTDVVTPPGKIRSKAMYDADKAISIDLHSPYKLITSTKEYIVQPSEGMLHHYRSYPMESFIKYPDRYNYIEDRYMEWMKLTLRRAYELKISEMRGRRTEL